MKNKRSVQEKLSKELKLNRIAGPFTSKPPGLIVSPLAAVPKKDSDEIRIIHDLSFPLGESVNSHINPDIVMWNMSCWITAWKSSWGWVGVVLWPRLT